MVNLIGTPGDDRLLIVDSAGFEGARGAGGNDTIENFNVNRIRLDLRGGDGDDLILGGSGGAALGGAGGDDVLVGGRADNFAQGGDGDDTISGGVDSDTMEGNNGDDVVGGLDDVLDFRDPFSFGGGFDRTFGGAGNDTVIGGAGDTLTGGTGADLFRLDPARVSERLPVLADFGPGQDRIEFLNLPELPEDTVIRLKAVAFGEPDSGVLLVCHVIAQAADGEQTFLGQLGLASAPNVVKFGFLNNIEIVNNDDPLI